MSKSLYTTVAIAQIHVYRHKEKRRLTGLTMMIHRGLPHFDPEALDIQAKADPAVLVNWFGARDKAFRMGATPRPGLRPKTSRPPTKSKMGRNQPCPCGSGIKFKKCCGR